MDDAGGPRPHAYGYDGVDPSVPYAGAPSAPPPGRSFWSLRRIFGGLVVLAVLFAVMVAWLSWSLPVSRALEPLPTPALVLISADGHPFARRGAVKDRPVEVEALPP